MWVNDNFHSYAVEKPLTDMAHHSPQRKHWRSLTANWRTLTLKTREAQISTWEVPKTYKSAQVVFYRNLLSTFQRLQVPSSPFPSHLTPFDVSAHTIWHERSHHLMWALTSNGVRWLSRRFRYFLGVSLLSRRFVTFHPLTMYGFRGRTQKCAQVIFYRHLEELQIK